MSKKAYPSAFSQREPGIQAKIAEKSGCAIIPLSLNNTIEIFEAHLPRIKKTHVIIEYGTPIYPKDLDRETRKHLDTYVSDIIRETIRKNAALV